mgnify:CR=1 FL=1
MNRVKVYIVDDEQKAIDTLSKVFTLFFEEVDLVGSAQNITEAYPQILDFKPDLVLLDIEMGKESGFQLLEKFENIDFHVAFVTAYEDFALRAIKFSALDYIIKPANVADLKTLLNKVQQNPKHKQEGQKVKQMFGNFLAGDKSEHKLTLAVADGYEFIKVDDILYLKADGSYTILVLKNAQKRTTSKNLKHFEGILSEYGFFRIHNSTIINLKYIQRFNKTAGGSVVMDNQAEFSISKSRKEEFMNVLSLR